MEELKFSKIRKVKSPLRANPTDAGIDFFIPEDFGPKLIHPSECVLIPSGIKANVPKGHALIAFNKSGVASKKCLDKMAEVVDETYQGEIHINIINNGSNVQELNPGDKIIQFILIPVSYAVPTECKLEDLYEEKSSRGEGGFGSTGT